jgi:hypothetical protein
MYNLCLLAGYSEEYIAGNHKQLNQMARDAFPELDRTEAEEVCLQLACRLELCITEYLYLLTYLLHGAESFLRS